MKILAVGPNCQLAELIEVGLAFHWPDCHVMTAAESQDALRYLAAGGLDLIVLDVGSPSTSSVEALKEIRRISDVPVLMVGERCDEHVQVRALELGADGYLTRPFTPLMLLAQARAVIRRSGRAPTAAPFVAGGLWIDFQNHEVRYDGVPVRLTPVEYKLLSHLVQNAGRLLTQEALIQSVWGEDWGMSVQALQVHMSRLRSKIERNGSRYIVNERAIGYRFVVPQDRGAVGDSFTMPAKIPA